MITTVVILTLLELVFSWMFCRGQKQLRATQKMAATQKLFMLWRAENPHRSTDESQLGEQILKNYLSAYKQFLLTHPYVYRGTLEAALEFEKTLKIPYPQIVH
jgi:hypothetical protein